jgi:DUF971 family protein
MGNIRPSEVTANRIVRIMTIIWSDAHRSDYPFSLLRHACPCAECQGGHDQMQSEPDPSVFSLPDEETRATNLQNVESVGSYALTITWEDGHQFGIFSWNYLRKLCPCKICRQG